MHVIKGCFQVKYFSELEITLRLFIPQVISYVNEVNLNLSFKKIQGSRDFSSSKQTRSIKKSEREMWHHWINLRARHLSTKDYHN